MVGVIGARRRQQQKEETVQLVVCSMRWSTRLASATQDIGGTTRCQLTWRSPNRLLVVQTGESTSQAKVFKSHAVPQGLCENLITALKLLANQQEDVDGLIQSIVTGFCE